MRAPAARAAVARPAEPIYEAENARPAVVEAKPKPADDVLPPEPIYETRNDRPAAVAAQPKAADAPRQLEPISERNDRPAAVAAQPKAADDAAAAAENPTGNGMLFTRKAPTVSVETSGPRTIVVGRESTYQVQLMNSGDVAAEELVVHVTLPAWAEVVRIEASLGEAKPPEAAPAGAIDWKVGHLNAKSHERLTIRIIPRQSRPFDLAVRWESKPIASQAMIEVQEPKLSLQLEGPHEVFYGKKEIYRLVLANKGSGNAENVTIVMTPVGTGENLPASHKVGVLAAGEQKSLEVELTAREGGTLSIQAEAHGDGGLHAELVEKVMVRRAGLKLDITGPKVQFVGSVATYSIRVHNTGTAPARNVSFSIALPPGARYLSGIDGARLDAAENRLVWGLDTLPADTERTFAIKCRLATVGATAVRLSAVADDDVAAAAETSVQVQTVATLTMDVSDPAGPVPVGEESVYEVHVRNRGTREAQNVEVFAYFSRGHRADLDRRRSEPPGAGTSGVPADRLARPRRGGGVEGPCQGGRGGQSRLPGGSPLPAVERPADQRGDEPLLHRRAGGHAIAAERTGGERSRAAREQCRKHDAAAATDSQHHCAAAVAAAIDALAHISRRRVPLLGTSSAGRQVTHRTKHSSRSA